MTDYTLADTIHIAFTTRSFTTGAPTVLAGTPVVSAYEDASLTQITVGITLGVDHDSVVGLNMLTIVATGANGYGSGQDYNLVITTGTVGGVSVVGEVVGRFTLGRSAAAVDLANGTDGLGAIKTDTAAILTDTADMQPKLGTPVTDISADIAVIEGQTDDIGVAGAGLTAINLPDQTMNITGNLSGSVGSVTGSVGSVVGHTAQTGDNFARLGAPAGASVSADVAAVKSDSAAILVDTADIQPKIGTPVADVSADIAAVKAETALIVADTNELQTDDYPARFDGVEGATFSTATDSLEAIRDRGDAAWTTGAGGSDRLLLVDTTIATLATQTSFTLTAGSADDDAYNNATIVIEDVSTATQKAIGMVLDYTGSTKTVTLKEALIFTIAATDKVYILAENALKSTVANRQLDVTATGGSGINWANVENPATALDLSGTDIQLVDTVTTLTGHTAQTGDSFARLGAPAGASVSADIAAVKVDAAAILVDTADIQPKIGTPAADVSADIAAVKVDTAATLVDTAEIGAAGAGLTAIDLPDQIMDITGNLSGSVGSVTGSVGSVVGHTPQTGDNFARLGVPAGASVSADIAVIEGQTDDIGVAGAGLTAIPTIANVTTVATLTGHTPQTGDNFTRLGAPAGASVSADVADVKVDTSAILTDTAEIGVAGAGLTDLGGMSTGMKAEVNTEVVDVMKVDTVTLPGQVAPPLTPTFEQMQAHMYKAYRNRKRQTSTIWELLADNETTVDHKATVSDDGTTAIKQEIVAGP